MDSQTIANPLPLAQRTGRPRSFWAILGLSIVTCSVYYIVYHYLVAGELKRAAKWSEDEDYKPGLFVWIYSALVVFWALSVLVFGVQMASDIAKYGLANIPMPSGKQLFMQYGITGAMQLLGYYTTFYFLKLQIVASDKVGIKRKSIWKPLAPYVLATLISIALGIFIQFTTDQNSEFVVNENIAKALVRLAIQLGLSVTYFTGILYFLWQQTELVNRIWVEGRFAAPVALTPQIAQEPLGAQPAPPTYLSPGTQSPRPQQAPPGTIPRSGGADSTADPKPPAPDSPDNPS